MSAPIRVRIGVFGTGAVAQAVHLPLLAKRADLFEVVSLCDLSRATLDAVGVRYGVSSERRFGSLGELLAARGIDAVMILSSGSHGAAAAAAARAGLPVFCEKPLAYTLAETEELTEARLALGYMKLYDPAVVRAREIVRKRSPARSIEVTVLHPSAASQLAHAGPLATAADVPPETLARLRHESDALAERALGMAARELGRLYTDVLLGSVVHDLAVVRDLVGDPVRIDHAETWGETSVVILATLPGEARLSIRWHYLEGYPAYREEVAVHDERGTVAVVFPSPYLLHAATVLTVAEAEDGAVRTTRFRSTAEAFERELAAFYELVTTGAPPASGVAEGRADIVTCQAVVRRLAEQRGLELGGEALRG